MLLFFVIPLVSNSQRKVIFDTTIVNTTSKDFFEKNIVIDSISFTYPKRIVSLFVYPKSIWYDSSYKKIPTYNSEYYNYEFLGDQYLFEKKYGQLKIPEKEMAMLLAKSCDPNPSISMVARIDSIKFIMKSNCAGQSSDFGSKANGEDDEDKVFTKVEVGPSYKNGIGVLKNQIEAAFKKRHFENKKSITESALIFEITVDRKDSCLKRIKLLEGSYSGFAQFVMDELKTNCGWKAGIAGGRPVMS